MFVNIGTVCDLKYYRTLIKSLKEFNKEPTINQFLQRTEWNGIFPQAAEKLDQTYNRVGSLQLRMNGSDPMSGHTIVPYSFQWKEL